MEKSFLIGSHKYAFVPSSSSTFFFITKHTYVRLWFSNSYQNDLLLHFYLSIYVLKTSLKTFIQMNASGTKHLTLIFYRTFVSMQFRSSLFNCLHVFWFKRRSNDDVLQETINKSDDTNNILLMHDRISIYLFIIMGFALYMLCSPKKDFHRFLLLSQFDINVDRCWCEYEFHTCKKDYFWCPVRACVFSVVQLNIGEWIPCSCSCCCSCCVTQYSWEKLFIGSKWLTDKIFA